MSRFCFIVFAALAITRPVAAQGVTTAEWTQVLASPRIGTRLTALAADEEGHIFVGSEVGTIQRSEDGGTTWTEVQIDPFMAIGVDPTARPRFPFEVGSGEADVHFVVGRYATAPSEEQMLRPSFRPFSGSIGALRFTGRTGFLPEGIDYFDPPPPVTFLDEILNAQARSPIGRIVVCPGNSLSVLASRRGEVLGSPDYGVTWVRVLHEPRSVQIPVMACDPSLRDHVVMAGFLSTYESFDGGYTVDIDLSGFPRYLAGAVEFGRDGTLYVSGWWELYARAPGETEPRMIYPDYSDARLARWRPITWIDEDRGELWVSTEDGMRRSVDQGARFINVDPSRFSNQVVIQTISGRSETGAPLQAAITRECLPTVTDIAAASCRNSEVLASVDEGVTWQPFFVGMTRRTIEQLAYADGHWLILTGGELWMSAYNSPRAVDPSMIGWARQQLDSTPDLAAMTEAVLAELTLQVPAADAFVNRARDWAWIPAGVQVQLSSMIDVDNSFARLTPILRENVSSVGHNYWSTVVSFQWNLDNAFGMPPDLEAQTRSQLYELRRRIMFTVEDAWHERVLHLQRLSDGRADPYQGAILRERIHVLEEVLRFWTHGTLLTRPSPGRRRRG